MEKSGVNLCPGMVLFKKFNLIIMKKIAISVAVACLIVLGGCAQTNTALNGQKQSGSGDTQSSSTAVTSGQNQAVVTNGELAKFVNDELGFSFSYPSSYGKLDFWIKDGETGKIFYGIFEKVPLEFGGITDDFSEGRAGWFTDYKGGPVSGDENKIGLKTVPVVGGNVIIVAGEGELGLDNPHNPAGTYVAQVDLKGKKFHGLAFTYGITRYHRTDGKKVDLAEFESVLKTLEIK